MMLLAVTLLPLSRLPDYGQGLAAPEVEADAPYSLHLPAVGVERDLEVLDLEYARRSSPWLPHSRVEGVAQAVAQQVEADISRQNTTDGKKSR